MRHLPEWIVLAFLLLSSCSSCSEVISQTQSPDGKYTAELVLLGGCGGATVSFYTDLAIGRQGDKGRLEGETVWRIRGRVPAQVAWKSSKLLEVRYAPLNDVVLQSITKSKMFQDVNIIYVEESALSNK
jgi:hypothetical protein